MRSFTHTWTVDNCSLTELFWISCPNEESDNFQTLTLPEALFLKVIGAELARFAEVSSSSKKVL